MHKPMKTPPELPMMQIENFGEMQSRYQMLPLPNRALAVINDAEPALTTAQRILKNLSAQAKISQAVANLRSNGMIIGRIRASEAKSALMDEAVNFIQATDQKLALWSKTLHQIAAGKAKAVLVKDMVPEHLSIPGVSGYLSLIKLVIIELSKIDKNNSDSYSSMLGEIRRCATILSDCECASELNSVVIN